MTNLPPDVEVDLVPERRLAVAVVATAVGDAAAGDPGAREWIVESAGDPELVGCCGWWAALAGIDALAVRDRVLDGDSDELRDALRGLRKGSLPPAAGGRRW